MPERETRRAANRSEARTVARRSLAARMRAEPAISSPSFSTTANRRSTKSLERRVSGRISWATWLVVSPSRSNRGPGLSLPGEPEPLRGCAGRPACPTC